MTRGEFYQHLREAAGMPSVVAEFDGCSTPHAGASIRYRLELSSGGTVGLFCPITLVRYHLLGEICSPARYFEAGGALGLGDKDIALIAKAADLRLAPPLSRSARRLGPRWAGNEARAAQIVRRALLAATLFDKVEVS